jgi:hypothetical protein
MKKSKPSRRPTPSVGPSETSVKLTALLYADDPAVEKELREHLASMGITTADQMRVIAQAELVWVKRYLHEYPTLRKELLTSAKPVGIRNPTFFGILACHTLERIEREIGTIEPVMRSAMIAGYAIMWEAALKIDTFVDKEAAKQRRQKGTEATKAKAQMRRDLAKSLIDAAAKDRRAFDVEQIAATVGCSTSAIYRYMREASKPRAR